MFINPQVVSAVEVLGITVAFTMSSDIVGQILHQTPPLQTEISLDSRRAAVLPIVDSVKDIGSGSVTVNRDSCMCLCRNERFLLLWSSSVHGIVTHGTDIEARLFSLVKLPLELFYAA